MTSHPVLKNCPFCDGKPEIVKTITEIKIFCNNCNSTSGNSNSEQKAIEKWNTRYKPECDHVYEAVMRDPNRKGHYSLNEKDYVAQCFKCGLRGS